MLFISKKRILRLLGVVVCAGVIMAIISCAPGTLPMMEPDVCDWEVYEQPSLQIKISADLLNVPMQDLGVLASDASSIAALFVLIDAYTTKIPNYQQYNSIYLDLDNRFSNAQKAEIAGVLEKLYPNVRFCIAERNILQIIDDKVVPVEPFPFMILGIRAEPDGTELFHVYVDDGDYERDKSPTGLWGYAFDVSDDQNGNCNYILKSISMCRW